ncbi:MAG: hypothetical protein GC137_09310 [Alphaproteobacteria bacterium]|nr:hypothetical protein [Alphaproteobacteria bacterium]
MSSDIPYAFLETELRRTIALKGHEGEQLRDVLERAGFSLVPQNELRQLRADSEAHEADLEGTVEVERLDAWLKETGSESPALSVAEQAGVDMFEPEAP